MRYALVNLSSNKICNVVEMAAGDGSSIPHGFRAVPSDIASIGDDWDGENIIRAPSTVETVLLRQ